MLSRCTMHFPVVVLYELLDECTVLVQDLVSHVGNVVKNCLIFYHEVLLRWGPCVHCRDRVHGVYDADWNLLCCHYSWCCGKMFVNSFSMCSIYLFELHIIWIFVIYCLLTRKTIVFTSLHCPTPELGSPPLFPLFINQHVFITVLIEPM